MKASVDEVFEAVLTAQRRESGVESDSDLDADAWKAVTIKFREIIRTYTGREFPTDPYEQLKQATEAVFKSWNGKRAIDYRNAANIPHDLGTAVNIVAMVFGNMGDDSATGVAFTRNPATGDNKFYGEWLINAQGEDVVADQETILEFARREKVHTGDMPSSPDRQVVGPRRGGERLRSGRVGCFGGLGDRLWIELPAHSP